MNTDTDNKPLVVRAAKRHEIAALHKRMAKAAQAVREAVRKIDGREKLFLKRQKDLLRLTTLLVWEERYKVSVEWILRQLLPVWRKRTKQPLVRGMLGCRVPVLVGKKSEVILQECIAREFPSSENVEDWRWRRRRELLGLNKRGLVKPVTLVHFDRPRDFVQAYRERIEKRTKRLERATANATRRRRPYRDNAWR